MRSIFLIAQKLHTNIAADVWPNGGRLVCRECGTEQIFDVGDAATFLGHGWPRCCGKSMRVEEAQPAAESLAEVAA